MINTRVEHISSAHSFGMYRFSLSMDSCVTHAENQSTQAEALEENLKELLATWDAY